MIKALSIDRINSRLRLAIGSCCTSGGVRSQEEERAAPQLCAFPSFGDGATGSRRPLRSFAENVALQPISMFVLANYLAAAVCSG